MRKHITSAVSAIIIITGLCGLFAIGVSENLSFWGTILLLVIDFCYTLIGVELGNLTITEKQTD